MARELLKNAGTRNRMAAVRVWKHRLRQVERLLADRPLSSNVLAPEEVDSSEALHALQLRLMLTVGDDFDPTQDPDTPIS